MKLVGNTIQKTDKRVMLDCSAIAKGYGSDIVARFLRRNGIKTLWWRLVVRCYDG